MLTQVNLKKAVAQMVTDPSCDLGYFNITTSSESIYERLNANFESIYLEIEGSKRVSFYFNNSMDYELFKKTIMGIDMEIHVTRIRLCGKLIQREEGKEVILLFDSFTLMCNEARPIERWVNPFS